MTIEKYLSIKEKLEDWNISYLKRINLAGKMPEHFRKEIRSNYQELSLSNGFFASMLFFEPIRSIFLNKGAKKVLDDYFFSGQLYEEY